MGKDIHIVMEIRKDGKWQYIDDIIDSFTNRYYRFFEILEDNFGHRGIPDELMGKRFKYHEKEDYWDFDFTADWIFGHSYFTLAELKNYYNGLNKVTVSEDFLRIFFELGGTLPKEMSLSKEDTNKIYVQPLDEEDEWLDDFLSSGIKEFEKIAEKYSVSPDDIRIVFGFDW